MATVRVWNDNKFDYVETFKGEKLRIPAGKSIEMEFYDAHQFKGTYKPMVTEGSNDDIAANYKMIRIEEIKGDAPTAEVKSTRCQACSYVGAGDADLADHARTFHAGQHVVDEEAEAVGRKTKKKAG